MELTERKKRILRAIIDEYVATAEPVGSKAIVQKAELGLSSATIRNEMAELEDEGYLEQPHTSAGRVPSAKGYRIYVNELMNRQRLSVEETEEINAALRGKMRQLDRVISDAGKLTSRLTSLPAFAVTAAAARVTATRFDLLPVDENSFIAVVMLSCGTVQNRVMRLGTKVDAASLPKLAAVLNSAFTGKTAEEITGTLIRATEQALGDEDGLVAMIAGFTIEILSEAGRPEAYVSGTSHLLEHPEFRDADKAGRLMEFLSEGQGLQQLLPPESGDLKITIGPENVMEELKDSSVVMASYDAGDNMRGLIGVVAPTRMDYSNVAAKLSYIANGLSKMLSGGGDLPALSGRTSQEDDDE